MKEIGQPRGVGFVIVMSIVTLGIYAIYWTYKSYSEVKRYRGQGVGGLGGLLLCLVIVGTFLLPAYIGRMQKEDGQMSTVSGWTGCFALIPYIGGFILIAKNQGALNAFWEGKAAQGGAPAAAPVATTV